GLPPQVVRGGRLSAAAVPPRALLRRDARGRRGTLAPDVVRGRSARAARSLDRSYHEPALRAAPSSLDPLEGHALAGPFHAELGGRGAGWLPRRPGRQPSEGRIGAHGKARALAHRR